jgi:hypothetical protein
MCWCDDNFQYHGQFVNTENISMRDQLKIYIISDKYPTITNKIQLILVKLDKFSLIDLCYKRNSWSMIILSPFHFSNVTLHWYIIRQGTTIASIYTDYIVGTFKILKYIKIVFFSSLKLIDFYYKLHYVLFRYDCTNNTLTWKLQWTAQLLLRVFKVNNLSTRFECSLFFSFKNLLI